MSVLAYAQAAVLVAVIGGAVAKHPRGDDKTPAAPSSLLTPLAGRIDATSVAGTPTAVEHASITNFSPVTAITASLIIPVVGVISSALHDNFTERRSGGRTHEAIDIMAPRGTPVVSATEGRLLRLHTSKAGGLMVYAADSTDQFILMYAHLDRYATGLVEGAPLHRGQVIGYVGTTGNAPPNAPHLHFAIARGEPSVKWWKGVAVDPYPLLVSASPSLAPAVQMAALRDTSKSPVAKVALRPDTATKPRSQTVNRKTATPSSKSVRTLASKSSPSKQRLGTKAPSTKESRTKA